MTTVEIIVRVVILFALIVGFVYWNNWYQTKKAAERGNEPEKKKEISSPYDISDMMPQAEAEEAQQNEDDENKHEVDAE